MTTWLRGVAAAWMDMRQPASRSQRVAIAVLLVGVVLACGLGPGPS